MKKITLLIAFCLLAAGQVFSQAYVDPKLETAMAENSSLLEAATPLQVIVTFKGTTAPSILDISLLTRTGITQGLTFQSLPIAGILATPSQVKMLAKSSRILSLYLNEKLEYYNDSANALTGVDKARAEINFTTRNGGFPISGKGIGVVVNDSGVDGTHPDLQLGKNLKQNVLGSTNLNGLTGGLLPFTWIENVPNTDTNSGHGTHVAGTIGGTGQASNGKYTGVAPGASLIGYGSGGGLLVLDGIGGFDYALTNQYQYDIRIISNSWGSTGEYDPLHPINIASKLAYDRNIVTLFAAGNAGPGSDTHNPYAIAPWVISVGAGDKSGRLAGFSSRGVKDEGGTFSLDGKIWTYENKPTIVAPGVDLISTRTIAPTSSLAIDQDAEELEAQHVPFYTHMSGTSMATPHAAGIVALLLEADPSLTVDEVKEILEQTATNMPGHESWEVGAGYVNAYAAIDKVFRTSAEYGSTLNINRTFNSTVNVNTVIDDFTVDYNPATPATNTYTFNVTEGTTGFEAKIQASGVLGQTGNPVNLIVYSPGDKESRSGIPVLFATTFDRTVSVASPEAGLWTIEVAGLEGVAFPETINGTVKMMTAAGTSGLNDIADHPAEASIKMAVGGRLADGLQGGGFKPDELLKRIDMADYLMMGGGIRQFLPTDGTYTISDVKDKSLIAESIVADGAALRDKEHKFNGVMLPQAPGKFSPKGKVNRAEVAYSLVQSLGFQEYALERNGQTPTVSVNGESYPLEDADEIPTGLEGYVSVALDLNLINAYYTVSQGDYDLEPTLHASFEPLKEVTRADFAVIITRTFDLWQSASEPQPSSATATSSEESLMALDVTEVTAYSYPNPFSGTTTISYPVNQDGPVQVVVYDMYGKKVRTLVSEDAKAGNYSVQFNGQGLPGGTYIFRVETGKEVYSQRVVLKK